VSRLEVGSSAPLELRPPAGKVARGRALSGLCDLCVRRTTNRAGRPAQVLPRRRVRAVQLEPEQQQLFVEMAEATLAAPREQREWFMFLLDQGAILGGPWGQRRVTENDVRELVHVGLLRPVSFGNEERYVMPPAALAAYGEMKASEGSAVERVEAEVRNLLDTHAFRAAYPEAYEQWSDAERRLWGADSERELTTIGLKAREALQTFATEVVERYQPPAPDPDKAKVNLRLGVVIAMLLPALGEKRAAHLRALGDYSEATVGLVQRQTHGAQKEGEPLTRADARSVVFHVAMVMFEFARALEGAASEGR
jgi:hypothetical protein